MDKVALLLQFYHIEKWKNDIKVVGSMLQSAVKWVHDLLGQKARLEEC